MIKNKHKVVFVVLVYRNTADLEDFFSNQKIKDSKVIVVNSFYDKDSACKFETIAKSNGSDFINVPNDGYGAGNNKGVEYALKNYDFDFLIISNADISIRQLDVDKLSTQYVTAPKIVTLSGKNQNPSAPFKPSKLKDYLLYRTYKGDHNRLIWLFWAYSRINKILFYGIHKFRHQIFSPHGAFIIIPKSIVEECIPLFNEKMFLFNEESHLGRLLKKKGYKTQYNPNIVIDHKEDGSVSLLNDSLFKLQKDSYLELYKYWHKK